MASPTWKTKITSAPLGFWTRVFAICSCVLSAASWMLVIVTWSWLLSRPRGAFGEMGGIVFIFYIFPLTLCGWLVGGPVALALGGCAAKRVQSGKGTRRDGELAGAGIILSRVMLWGGVALLLYPVGLGLLRAILR